MLTFSLSRGALKFAKEKIIVKRLSSVQDVGSINLLCTDKTGTITENRLRYADEFTITGLRFHPLLLVHLAAINLKERIPEHFDKAADESLSIELRHELGKYELIEQEAFYPAQRSNGAIVQRIDGLKIPIRRGSPEYFTEQGLVPKEFVNQFLTEEEKKGHRVLSVSYYD